MKIQGTCFNSNFRSTTDMSFVSLGHTILMPNIFRLGLYLLFIWSSKSRLTWILSGNSIPIEVIINHNRLLYRLRAPYFSAQIVLSPAPFRRRLTSVSLWVVTHQLPCSMTVGLSQWEALAAQPKWEGTERSGYLFWAVIGPKSHSITYSHSSCLANGPSPTAAVPLGSRGVAIST